MEQLIHHGVINELHSFQTTFLQGFAGTKHFTRQTGNMNFLHRDIRDASSFVKTNS